MKLKALKSFAGKITMRAGEVKEVVEDIAKDLLRAGYAERVDDPDLGKTSAEKPVENTADKPAKKKKTKK